MGKTLFILGLAALASARNIKVDQLEYGFCDGSAEPGSIDNASVEPFPIVLATGETITLSVQLTLNEPIPVGAQVSLKIKKEGLIDVPFPCLEIEVFTLDLVIMMGTTSLNLVLKLFAQLTSPMAKNVPFPSTLEPMVEILQLC